MWGADHGQVRLPVFIMMMMMMLTFFRFVMRLSDSSWHEECLFCSQCHSPLVNSCYYRDGKLFCRVDYERSVG